MSQGGCGTGQCVGFFSEVYDTYLIVDTYFNMIIAHVLFLAHSAQKGGFKRAASVLLY